VKNNSSLILIVEDYLPNLQILAKTLESSGYNNIAIASNGEDALKTASQTKPDLILLDVTMPGISGYEVCETLRSKNETQNIPIIFLTAKIDPEDIEEGYQKGGSDYIYKPFNTPELLARVKTHLQLKKAKEELLRNDPLTLPSELLQMLEDTIAEAISEEEKKSHSCLEKLYTAKRLTNELKANSENCLKSS